MVFIYIHFFFPEFWYFFIFFFFTWSFNKIINKQHVASFPSRLAPVGYSNPRLYYFILCGSTKEMQGILCELFWYAIQRYLHPTESSSPDLSTSTHLTLSRRRLCPIRPRKNVSPPPGCILKKDSDMNHNAWRRKENI